MDPDEGLHSVERDRGGSGFRRGSATWLIYLVWTALGFAVNGLGSVLLPMRRELGLSAFQTSLYSAFFALGLVATGLVGHRVVEGIGRGRLLMLVLAVISAGGVVMTFATTATTFVGAAGIGVGAALLVQVLPAELVALQPDHAPRALSEANSLSSAAGIVAPLGVAAALAAGLGWGLGYSVPLAVAAAVALVLVRFRLRARTADVAEPDMGGQAAVEPTESPWRPWLELVGAVAVEFCFVLWSATALATWHHATASSATLIAGCFLVGMGLGRLIGAPLAGRFGLRRTTLGSLAVALLGSLAFWSSPNEVVAAAALLVSGLGVSLLYPLTLSRMLAADPVHSDRATSRGALASGVAILVAPPLLAWIADLSSLKAAFLIAPVLLVALVVRNLGQPPRARRTSSQGRATRA